MHLEYEKVSNNNEIKILVDSGEELGYNITETMFSDIIMSDFNITDMHEMINKVKRFYIADGIINQTEFFSDLIIFASDFSYNYPIQRRIVRYVESGLEVYQYIFS